MAKSKNAFTVKVKINEELRDNIRMSIVGNADFKKEVLRVLQQANRRAQNIEKSGVVSPAYQSLVLEGRQGYSKFKISGLDINNETQWQQVKYEYSKALEYLYNPTSSATGAKQYINSLSKKYNKPIDFISNVLRQSTDTQFKGNEIPLLNYRSMIDNFMTDSKNELNNMNSNAQALADEMEQNVKNATEQVVKEIEQTTEQIMESFKNAFKIK